MMEADDKFAGHEDIETRWQQKMEPSFVLIVSFQSCHLCLCAHFVSKKKMQITNGPCCGISTRTYQALSASHCKLRGAGRRTHSLHTPIPTLTSTRTQRSQVNRNPISMTRHASSTHTTCSIMFDVLLRSFGGCQLFSARALLRWIQQHLQEPPKESTAREPMMSRYSCMICVFHSSIMEFFYRHWETLRTGSKPSPGQEILGGLCCLSFRAVGDETHVDVWWCLGFGARASLVYLQFVKCLACQRYTEVNMCWS